MTNRIPIDKPSYALALEPETKDGQLFLQELSHPENRIPIPKPKAASYKELSIGLSGITARSYLPYLLSLDSETEPTEEQWNNLLFLGHRNGQWNAEECRFDSAKDLGQEAASPVELSYLIGLKRLYRIVKLLSNDQ